MCIMPFKKARPADPTRGLDGRCHCLCPIDNDVRFRPENWWGNCHPFPNTRSTKRYKTFRATWRPAGGAIRVVLVDEPKGWVAFFCTDPEATVVDILGLVAERFCLETCFRDCKEIVGAGQQQVRHVWASVGSFHVCLWTFTMTEAWAWNRSAAE